MQSNLSPKTRTILWCLGLAYLVIPYALLKFGITEPYPAIILPGGAAKIRIEEGRLPYSEWTIEAIMPDGAAHQLDPRTFFRPVKFWPFVAKRDFGFAPPKTRTVNLRVAQLTFKLSRENSPEDLEQVRAWIKQRVVAAGYRDASSFRAVLSRSHFNIQEKELEDQKVVSEFTIDLD